MSYSWHCFLGVRSSIYGVWVCYTGILWRFIQARFGGSRKVSTGEEVQNFLVSPSSSELTSHQTAMRTCGGGFLQVERSTSPALRVSRTIPPRWALLKFLVEGLANVAPPRPKGRPRSPSLCSSTTPSRASQVTDVGLVHGLHFNHGVEQACSAAARVTSSLAHLGPHLLPRLDVLCLHVRGAFSCRGAPPAAPSLQDPHSLRSPPAAGSCPRQCAVVTSPGAAGRVSQLR